MKLLLNLLPIFFLLAAAFTGYSFWTADSGLLKMIPLTVAFASAFVTSLAWRISSERISSGVALICFLATIILGIYLYYDPSVARSVWTIMCLVILISVHAALFSIAASSYLFTDGRRLVLLLPVFTSLIGIAGVFIWNGSLALCGIGLVASVIFALIASLFGMPKTRKEFNPENN